MEIKMFMLKIISPYFSPITEYMKKALPEDTAKM